MNTKAYKTIKFSTESEFKEKNSKFITKAFYINSEKEAGEILDSLRKEYYDATHHCYAYLLRNGKSKASDDGEPHGTAGVKILSTINHFELRDCLVVVIRYFGGTKLGVGPLGKAYSTAAFNCLSKVEAITKNPFYQITLNFALEHSNKILKYLHSNKIKIIKETYDSDVKIKCKMPIDTWENHKKKLLEICKGDVVIINDNQIIFE